MIDNHKNGALPNGSNGAVKLMPSALPTWELSPREPHLYDYLLILRKHQWLILSFMLSVVTIVAIATFRMQPVYVATARVQIDRENSNILPFQGMDSYDLAIETDVQRNFQSQYDSTTRATTWLRDQLDELKIRVQKSEDARIAYERQNQIWTLDDKQNITTQRFADANRELTLAQSERVKRQAILEFAKSGNIDAVPQIQSDAALAEFQKRLTDTTTQYREALEQYGPNFPRVRHLQSQIKDLQNDIQKEKQNIIDTLDSEYRQAVAREMMLGKELDIQKRDVNEMAGKMVEYNILKREAEANKVLYDGLLTKLREAGGGGGVRLSDNPIRKSAMYSCAPSRAE